MASSKEKNGADVDGSAIAIPEGKRWHRAAISAILERQADTRSAIRGISVASSKGQPKS